MVDKIEMYSMHDKEKVKLGTALSISEDEKLFELLSVRAGVRARTLIDLMNDLDK